MLFMDAIPSLYGVTGSIMLPSQHLLSAAAFLQFITTPTKQNTQPRHNVASLKLQTGTGTKCGSILFCFQEVCEMIQHFSFSLWIKTKSAKSFSFILLRVLESHSKSLPNTINYCPREDKVLNIFI